MKDQPTFVNITTPFVLFYNSFNNMLFLNGSLKAQLANNILVCHFPFGIIINFAVWKLKSDF